MTVKVKFKKKVTDVDRRRFILRVACTIGLSLALIAEPKVFNPRMIHAENLNKEEATTEAEVATSSENEIIDPANHDFNLDDPIIMIPESNPLTPVEDETGSNETIPVHIIEEESETDDTKENVSNAQEETNDSPVIVVPENTQEQETHTTEVENEDSPQTSPVIDTTADETTDEILEEAVTTSVDELEPEIDVMLNLSETEYAILCRIVEAEVTGTASDLASVKHCSEQDIIECKANVARVIINRVLSSEFPNSVEGVVFQKRQFSPISDGRYYRVSVTDDTKAAVDYALNRNSPVDASDCRYF